MMVRKRVREAMRVACGAIGLISTMGRKEKGIMVVEETGWEG